MLASAKGHTEVVRSLLAMGADADAENRYGESAIDLAVEEGYLGVVRLLLKAR
jgi:ankyrin repeat protein